MGDPVELHSTFENTWVRGFEIVAVVDGGYSVRRVYDDTLLPSPTGAADVRPASDVPWSTNYGPAGGG